MAECQCSVNNSNCIHVSGSGTSSDPFVFVPNLDPMVGNLTTCGSNGLLSLLPTDVSNPPRVKARRTVDQPLPGGNIPQYIAFNHMDWDVGGWWDQSNDPTALVCPEDGTYDLKFFAAIGSTGTGTFPVDLEVRASVMKNFTDEILLDVTDQPNPQTGSRLKNSCDVELVAGDIVAIRLFSGGASMTTVHLGDLGIAPFLSLRRVTDKHV